jgi:hypothetical protein
MASEVLLKKINVYSQVFETFHCLIEKSHEHYVQRLKKTQ